MPININGIKAAMFNTPRNYTESVNYYKRNLQDKIDETYEYASDTYEIEQEQVLGTMTFTKVVCRVCHAIEPKTGLNLGDDFKDLKFFNIYGERRSMGQRYRFDDSVWITTNTDNLHYVTQSAIVRRCNNTMNFIDSTGNIIEEPCIVGYAMKYANIYYNTNIDVAQGTISVTVQANNNTDWIEVNDRFIFNDIVYKVKSVKNYLQNETGIYRSNPLIEFDMFVDAKSPDDDFGLRIANMNKYSGIYPPVVPVVKNGIFVTPDITEIYQGQTVSFECYNYINDVKQADIFDFYVSGPSIKSYNFQKINGNSFSINCLSIGEVPLNILCTTSSGSINYKLILRGLF